MPLPGISRLIIRGLKAASGRALTPLRIKRVDLGAGRMTAVQKILFNGQKTGQQSADALRAVAKSDPKAYRESMAAAVRSYMEPVMDAHAAANPGPSAAWTPEARNVVYQSTLDCPDGGHITLIASVEGHAEPSTLVRDPGGVNHYVHGFPGSGILMKPEHYLQLLRQMRQIDGMPVNMLGQLMPDLIQLHKDMAGKDPTGLFAQLGVTSTVQAEASGLFETADFGNHTTQMSTTSTHILDGIAGWSRSYLAKYGDRVGCSSLHFGKNPVPGLDTFNVAAIPYLFKCMNERGTALHTYLTELRKKNPNVDYSAGLFDPKLRAEFEGSLPAWSRLHTSVFSAMSNLGEAAVEARLFVGGNTTADVSSTLSADQITAVENEDDIEPMLAEGAKVTVAEGNQNALPSASLPAGSDAQIMPPAQTAICAPEVIQPSQTPLLSVFQPAADAIGVAAQSVQKSLVLASASDVLTTSVQDAVRDMPALTQPEQLPTIVASVDTAALREPVRQAVDNTVLASMAGSSAVADAAASYGIAGAEALVGMHVTDPLWSQMTAEQSGSSFVQSIITSSVANAITHELHEQATTIEARLASAVDLVKKANDAKAARQPALELELAKVKAAQQEKPNDPALVAQRQALEKELTELEKQFSDAEAERAGAEKAKHDNEVNARNAVDAAANAERDAKAREAEISKEKVLA